MLFRLALLIPLLLAGPALAANPLRERLEALEHQIRCTDDSPKVTATTSFVVEFRDVNGVLLNAESPYVQCHLIRYRDELPALIFNLFVFDSTVGTDLRWPVNLDTGEIEDEGARPLDEFSDASCSLPIEQDETASWRVYLDPGSGQHYTIIEPGVQTSVYQFDGFGTCVLVFTSLVYSPITFVSKPSAIPAPISIEEVP